jgi:hypothetical protein
MWVPEPKADGLRRYRVWAGNPDGRKEDVSRCVCSVSEGGRSVLSSQCMRKRGHGPDGLYCKQHASKIRMKG